MNFENIFGEVATFVETAHASTNLIGTFTGTQQGFALPALTSFSATVAVSSLENQFEIYAEAEKEFQTFDLKSIQPTGWLNGPVGCLKELAKSGFELTGAKIFLGEDFQNKADNSALRCVAMLKALRALGGFQISDQRLAFFAEQVAANYLDQHLSSHDFLAMVAGRVTEAVCIDMRHRITDAIQIPKDFTFFKIKLVENNSNSEAHLKTDWTEVSTAVTEQLKLTSLRDISVRELNKLDRLSPNLKNQAKYIIEENHRVLQAALALKNDDIEKFGNLLNDSYESFRQLLSFSDAEVENMISAARAAGATGVRPFIENMSAGNSKNIIALVESHVASDWKNKMNENPTCSEISSLF